MKTCTKCKATKKESEYYANKERTKDGLHSWCIECVRYYQNSRIKPSQYMTPHIDYLIQEKYNLQLKLNAGIDQYLKCMTKRDRQKGRKQMYNMIDVLLKRIAQNNQNIDYKMNDIALALKRLAA